MEADEPRSNEDTTRLEADEPRSNEGPARLEADERAIARTCSLAAHIAIVVAVSVDSH